MKLWMFGIFAVIAGLVVSKRVRSDNGNGSDDPNADNNPTPLDSVVGVVNAGVDSVLSTVGLNASPVMDPRVDRIAVAIAAAEGFSVPGSVPNRNHNPGDLRVDVNGKGVGRDALDFVIYGSDEDGWDALRRQVNLILTNKSHVYNDQMTIAEIAAKYTATAQGNWASIVASSLGVSQDTVISQV